MGCWELRHGIEHHVGVKPGALQAKRDGMEEADQGCVQADDLQLVVRAVVEV